MKQRVGITEEQRNLSYAKYYDKPLARVSEEKLKILEKPMDPSLALKIRDRNRVFQGRNRILCAGGRHRIYCQLYEDAGSNLRDI